MMICFRCTAETKELLDRLLASGAYKDYGEAIVAAIRNQVLMEQELAESGSLVIGSTVLPAITQELSNGQDTLELTVKPMRQNTITVKREKSESVVPLLFRVDSMSKEAPKNLAKLPGDMWATGQAIPLDRWILGQFNRLLPAKVNARALVHLFAEQGMGLSIKETAERIATEAAAFGDYLSALDAKTGVSRDEALATAFPTTAEDAEKGRSRYANQFVVYQNTKGELSGLMVDLKFINVVTHKKERRIIPTEFAWEFAQLPNPILDGPVEGTLEKFSPEERALLLRHIMTSVPVEAFAYKAILETLQKGNNTPEKMDAALKANIPADRLEKVSQSFLASQRSGAVSRMSDLGLVGRKREGVRVIYSATAAGQSFLTLSETHKQ